jgi:hypothetical protein
MPIETDSDGRDDNDGPHCRNCHVGSNNCDVCHDDDTTVSGNMAASATWGLTIAANKTSYVAQSYLRQSATAGLNGKCLDGGFSFPHRTLGANMLKDEIFGIDFDGDKVDFGGARTANGGSATASSGNISLDALAASSESIKGNGFVMWTGESRSASSTIPAVRNDNSHALVSTAVENLDSVCIDCHGDASYWNGSNSAYYSSGVDTPYTGVYGSGERGGWELLTKGLP